MPAPRMCFDRILPRDLIRPVETAPGPNNRVRAIAPKGKAWINGSTLSVRFMGGSPSEQATAKTQAGWWAAVANLKFDFNNRPNADIRISFDENDGAWSMIGTDARSIPANQATMNLGFLEGGHGFRVQLRHHRCRQPRGADEAVPAARLETVDARFRHRRHLGEQRRALRAGDGERAQLARADVREHQQWVLDGELEFPREHRHHRGRAAGVVHRRGGKARALAVGLLRKQLRRTGSGTASRAAPASAPA